MPSFSMKNETRAKVPRAGFRAIKEASLGKKYSLNLIFTTPTRMRKLNLTYRGLDQATDILSFPLSKSEGEIYISPSEARKESKKFDRKPDNFIYFLFIHGCVHLKGYDHSARMESIEARLRLKFKI